MTIKLKDTNVATTDIAKTASVHGMDIYADAEQFELAQRVCKGLSTATLLPPAYQGNMGNVLIAYGYAKRLRMDPLMVMQNLHVIHNRPVMSSALLIAVINQSKMFAGPLEYEEVGEPDKDTWGMRAVAYTHEGRRVQGPAVTMAIAKADGWVNRNGSKWKTMPEQMLRYRAAAWFARTICPELTLGLQTEEEVADIGRQGLRRPQTVEAKPEQEKKPEPVAVMTGEWVEVVDDDAPPGLA